MPNLKATCDYRSVGCNRGTGAADIHATTDSIGFGGGRSVVVLVRDKGHHLYGDKGHHLYTASHHLPHTALVRCVSWVKQTRDEEVLVYGCNDGMVKMWFLQQPSRVLDVCKHTTGCITFLAALQLNGLIYVASCGTDSEIKVHTVVHTTSGETSDTNAEELAKKEDTISEVTSINVPKSGFGISCTLVPYKDTVVLATSTDDCLISLYHVTNTTCTFMVSLAGHEDWVRSLDIKIEDKDSISLVSGSQDNYIRIWDISPLNQHYNQADAFEIRKQMISMDGVEYCVRVENILLGHENWVTSVRWMNNGMILSASMDKTLIMWKKDEEGLWSEHVHVGEVGGNNLGLFGAFPVRDCNMVISYSFQGAFQAWTSSPGSEETWSGVPMPGGHFNSVKDISWAPSGAFLVSASSDQSVRVSAQWKDKSWYEIARSQVHGHDMSCIDMISDTSYVSGSEEKVLRVFQAPTTFVSNLRNITGRVIDSTTDKDVVGAHIPALGLSNKAISASEMDQKPPEEVEYAGTATVKDYEMPYQVAFAPAQLSQPPVEEILLQNTLWPEVHKLYGHGYEVYQCTAAPNGRIIATSCKASQPAFAAIILWDSNSYEKQQELVYHKLTVTSLRFSPDSTKLLSVSRDREWVVWNIQTFTILAKSPPRSHARIIWDCAWYLDGSDSFVTVSRDKKLLVWDRTSEQGTVSESGNVSESACRWEVGARGNYEVSPTAVDASREGYLAVGFEDGLISILRRYGQEVCLILQFDRSACPTLTINAVRWRCGEPHELAAGSDDNQVVVFKINFSEENEEETNCSR